MTTKLIEVKNENCDYDTGIFPYGDFDVDAVYLKNKAWHLYGGFTIKSQKDLDEAIEEVVHEAKVDAANIKLVRTISVTTKEVSLSSLQNSKAQKQKAAAKKKIADLKKKFGV